MLGLPDVIEACLFDLDGVLTDTAAVHRTAWAATFDPLLEKHGQTSFTEADYDDYVDGKPRLDGVRDFLAARHIELPEGTDDDGPDAQTVHGVAARKNADVLARIKRDGVHVFRGHAATCRGRRRRVAPGRGVVEREHRRGAAT